MKLTIVIVNYNVQHFLEQCLQSVFVACKNLETETIVVDNCSVDGSVAMLKEKFPSVLLIDNKNNVGFAKANNQAIKQAKGEYVLLLNPDTLVEEDTFEKTIAYMDAHPKAGGLGVKMLDGKGNFLPESKRGLPTPAVAFYKIFGLSRLFPTSKIFSKYHLGYLDKEKINEVDVLSGAFMLLRKETLNKTGLLDEAFFMYGEDIDLSYRIVQAGYKNIYFPETRIIHYKGESTKKSSINYVLVFYKAMVIFANKHFSKKRASTFSTLIHLAIYLRASVAIINRVFQRMLLPIIDAFLLLLGLFLLKDYYHQATGIIYPSLLIFIAFPIYVIVWLFSIFLSGGYDKPISIIKLIRGILIGTVLILIGYALLSEPYRFSRALILLGTLWAMVSTISFRALLHLLGFKPYQIGRKKKKRLAIVGEIDEIKRVEELLSQTLTTSEFIAYVNPDNVIELSNSPYIAKLSQLKEVVTIFKIDEVIFCAKSISAQQIIQQMTLLEKVELDYKIVPPESLYIIGSGTIDSSEILSPFVGINTINNISNKRNKRMLDIGVSILFIPLYPLLIFIVKNPFGLILNCIEVLLGKKSWVGYVNSQDIANIVLPSIKAGILSPYDAIFLIDDATLQTNLLYAKDYSITFDLNIIWNGRKELGRRKLGSLCK